MFFFSTEISKTKKWKFIFKDFVIGRTVPKNRHDGHSEITKRFCRKSKGALSLKTAEKMGSFLSITPPPPTTTTTIIFFWKINENLILKRFEYQPESFNLKVILRVTV